MMTNRHRFAANALLGISLLTSLGRAEDFVNFETPHVHPIDLGPNGTRLALLNTPANQLRIYNLDASTPQLEATIPVGYDPVSARFRSADEVWVVNQISDSISIVDLTAGSVTQTIATADEPADVIFAGEDGLAYVSCSQANRIQVFDPDRLDRSPTEIPIEGEDPRALAVSPDGQFVYVAIFESGNNSTILGGGADEEEDIITFPPNVVNHPDGPYGGVNPPPNAGDAFFPTLNPNNPTPPKVGLIVRQDEFGIWRDDNGADWTAFVSGERAEESGRPVGWELIDHDVAIIETQGNTISYVSRLMNIGMTLAVNPQNGFVHLIGTDATNQIRFEPVVNGTFLRVLNARFHPILKIAPTIADLNPHLDYSMRQVPSERRNQSIGDPRSAAWDAQGERLFIAGMGSNNVIVTNGRGDRIAPVEGIEVGEGPTGIVIDDAHNRAYVLNRFDASLSTLDLESLEEIDRTPFFDPSPSSIQLGRKHLYDTHATSGLGHVSCASCHVDSRTDRLAWDLGDPSGAMIPLDATHNLGAGFPGLNTDFEDFHPMKGPMTTQTLQDIIGKEPHHWRGDRAGIEAFNDAFETLLGDDEKLSDSEMREFEDYLATIHFPPNPFRNLNNSLPTDLQLPGHYSNERFGAPGQPLPNGNAQRALNTIYRPISRGIDRQVFACVTCHTLPTGLGPNAEIGGLSFRPIPAGPRGEAHHSLVSVDGSTQKAIKVAQLRNLYDKTGFEMTQQRSRAGFGFLHDGSVDSIARFISESAFNVRNLQEVADLTALMLSFSGSDFGQPVDPFEPPGTASHDAHAAVGKQITIDRSTMPTDLIVLLDLAASESIDLIAKGIADGAPRGWLWVSADLFQSDSGIETHTLENLLSLAATAPITFTATPKGTGVRLGIDRDMDSLYDYDEIRALIQNSSNPFDPEIADMIGDNFSLEPDGIPDGENDFDNDGISNAAELLANANPIGPDQPTLSIAFNSTESSITIEWPAIPGYDYQVESRTNFGEWAVESGDLTITTAGELSWEVLLEDVESPIFFRVSIEAADGD